MNSMIEISATLLRFRSNFINEFGVAFYIQIFAHQEANIHQRQEVIRSLIFLTGNEDCIKNALKVLNLLSHKHFSLLQSHSVQLLVNMN